MNLDSRNTQTRVKHEILGNYLSIWGGITVNGLASMVQAKSISRRDVHFVYVDCFAYAGRYSGDQETAIQGQPTEQVFGSPIIGIQELDKLETFATSRGLDPRVNAILVERDRSAFLELVHTLEMAGFAHRVRQTGNFEGLANGEIAVINADCLELSQQLLAYTTSGYRRAFYLIDPWGPKGIPHGFVKSIVQNERHDVMINFMYIDFLRKSGMLANKALSPQHQQLVNHWTAAFNGDRWKEIVSLTLQEISDHRYWRDDVLEGIPVDDMEDDDLMDDEELARRKEFRLVSLYREVLQAMDAGLAVKSIPLKFADRERTMFYLFLTTHDGTGALAINEVIDRAQFLEDELRFRFLFAKRIAPPPGQLALALGDPIPESPRKSVSTRPPLDIISRDIHSRFSGRTLTRRDLYKELANSSYFPQEVNSALTGLRRSELVSFQGKLTNNSMLSFTGT